MDKLSLPSPPVAGPASAPLAQAPGAVTSLVQRWSGGDRQALDALIPLVYEELRRLAAQHMRRESNPHTMARTGLVHEAYLRLAHQGPQDLHCRAQFFALASSIMRHVLVDQARARRAAKRGGGAAVYSLDATGGTGVTGAMAQALRRDGALAVMDDTIDLIALNESLQALEALDSQQARVVEMRFFVGMGVDEVAQAMQLSPATVKREWATARAWLLRDLSHAPSLQA